MVFFAILIVVLGGLGWIRFAPSDAAYWHVDPKVTTDQDLKDGVRRRLAGDEAVFTKLNDLIMNTPRTTVLAGSAADGHVTYVTRSLWFGFPDYTTVQRDGDVLEIWARLRFGSSDLGVNKARVDGWLNALAQMGT
ncbi:DUF1499 domain-containing protein [Tropicibacter sp. R15_0]|uniref:DUF1499 domain-containing protein n=1 Tax=Tropicibacter sp. R15_0 TaxID=2821101 RepID=UPI00256FEAC0|nr:DUF1499 domain-containing protein [Tropicibacter sp. R15_0]